MPEITPRRRGELIRGVFKILLDYPDGLPAKTILEQLQQFVPPTAFEQTTYPTRPDTRRYEKIVRFSTISPVKAGWLIKDRGNWSLTDEGRRIYERFADPEQFAHDLYGSMLGLHHATRLLADPRAHERAARAFEALLAAARKQPS